MGLPTLAQMARRFCVVADFTQRLPVGNDSEAGVGKVVAEDFLDWYIEKRFGPLNRVEWEAKMPFGIAWDYCGRP